MTFTRIEYRIGKSKKAKTYRGQIPATTTVALNRYHSGMTVGTGWYSYLLNVDPIGAACEITGWFSDGRVSVNLPIGGCGVLGRADVEVVSWPAYVTAEQRAEFNTLRRLSMVDAGEMLDHNGNRIHRSTEGTEK